MKWGVKSAPKMMRSSYQELERENKKQEWRPLFRFIRSARLPWLLIAGGTVLNLMQGTLSLIFPKYTEEIYAGNFSISLAVTAVLVVLGQAILSGAVTFAGRYISYKNLMRFQFSIWRKLSRLPVSYFENNEPRELISRTTQDTLSLSEFFGFSISGTIDSIYTLIGSAVAITAYDWRLGLSQLICIPLCYVVGIIAGRFYFKMNNRIQGRLSDMTRYFSMILPYITLVKLFGQENREEKAGNGWIANHFKTTMDNKVATMVINFADTVTQLVQELTIIFVGLALIRQGIIDVSQWIAFYMYANMLNTQFRGLMTTWEKVKINQGCCARIVAAIDRTPEENNGTLDARNSRGDLEFKNVSFAYDQDNVLNNVNFTAACGKVTAIVGPSGAGKSTILNLVERFYTPGAGSVVWAGKDAREFELTSWRRNIGYIPQDTQILAGSIRDNIAHGVVGTVSQEALEDAARQADILDFIQSLPQGFDTDVGENGAKLSGGQKQRVAIARALLMDSQILLLDEATSSLDAESEHSIQQTLQKIGQSRTVLMVAHRLASVKGADKIVVMENSRVSAQGTHSELMSICPLYRRLVELQSADIPV